MRKVKIWWRFEGYSYVFKFYIHDILVVAGSREVVKGGNKRKSGEISPSSIFKTSHLYNSTSRLWRKPELDLWDKWLKPFWISERVLLEWIEDRITKGGAGAYERTLEELKNKIKDC